MSADPRIARLEHELRSTNRVGVGALARDLRPDGAPGDDSLDAAWISVLDAASLQDGDDGREARAAAERALVAARRHADPALIGVAARVAGAVRLACADLEAARAAFAEASELLHRSRDKLRLADVAVDRAWLALEEAQPDLGEARVAEAVTVYDAAGERRAAAAALVLGARFRRLLGDRAGAQDVLVGVLRRVGPEEPTLAPAIDGAFAEQSLSEGNPTEALRLARRALGRLGPALPRRRADLWELVGRAHRAQGDTEAAVTALRRAAEILDAAGWPADEPRARWVHLLLQDRAFAAARDQAEAWLARTGHERPGLHAARFDADPARAAVVHAMLLPSAVDARDWTAFAHHLRRAILLAESTGRRNELAADAAHQAGAMCASIGDGGAGPIARAVRAHSLALALYTRAGRTDDATRETRALYELGGRGQARKRVGSPDNEASRVVGGGAADGPPVRGPIPAGPFDLLRPIGRGATGEVWKGRHHDRRWPVAVKVLAPEQGQDPRFRLLLADEIRAMAALDHPNVVRVLGTGSLGPEAEAIAPATLRTGCPWFAMELAEGGTLDPLCGTLPWSQCRAVLLALLDALAHAHARGVVHLDLKPANVLLRTLPDGRRGVLLTDFGLAGLVARASGARLAGTPHYMAPEQFRGDRRDVGPWTDLYAFGCLAYHLLRGAPPFSGDLAALREAHARAPVPALGARIAVPPGVERWIERLLQKSATDRYQRAADAAYGLQRFPERVESLAPEFDPADAPLSVATVVLSIEGTPSAEPRLGYLRLDGARTLDAPPTPEEWRPVSPSRLDVDLAEAALALFSLRRPPLVGREGERDRLWAVLRDVVETGAPRVVRIDGPPGSGKSALARWLCERAHELGTATVLDATDGPDGQRGNRAMLVRHLRLEGLAPEDIGARLDAMVPTLPAAVRGDLAAMAVDGAPAVSLAEQVGAISALIGAIAAARPVVVRVAGSTADEALLVQVLGAIPAPVLVVCEGGADVAGPDPVSITLGPMSDRDVAALVDALIPLRSSLRARVVELAGGNPDLAVQLVAERLEADALVPADGVYDLRPGATLVLPSRTTRVYSEHIAREMGTLGPEDRTLACAAALLGMDGVRFRWTALCAAAATDGDAGADGPRLRLARLGGLIEQDGGLPRFHHPAVPLILREAWADLAAAELALRALEPEGPPALRWPLLLRAGRWSEAAEPLLLAARAALADGDPDRATECLDQRAEVRRMLGTDPSVDDAVLRARITWLAGRPCGAEALLAAELAAQQGAHAHLGEARLLLGCAAADAGDPARAKDELRQAVDAFAAAGDADAVARARIEAAHVARSTGELAAAAERYREALGPAVSPATDALARTGLARVALARGRTNEAETDLLSALHAARAAGARSVEGEVLCGLGDASRLSGRFAPADARYRAALAQAPWHDVRRVREIGLRRAMLRLAAGRVGEAAGQLDALPASEGLGPFEAVRILTNLGLAVRRDDRTWGAALEGAQRALETLRDADTPWLLELAGRRACDAGRIERARTVWRLATVAYRGLGRPSDAGRVERAAETLVRARVGRPGHP